MIGTGSTVDRLVIGPLNTAGQGFRWAEAVTEHLGVQASSFDTRQTILGVPRRPASFDYPVHQRLSHHRIAGLPSARRMRVRSVLDGATQVAVEGFAPLFRRMDRPLLERDLDYLLNRGISSAFIAHGSEFRDPDHHIARFAWSFYTDADAEWVTALRVRARRNRQLATERGLPVFVSTPDQLSDAPYATWLPVCVDMAAWESSNSVFADEVPTVLHVPSRRHPPIKGTADIEPVLRELEASGRIRYVSPERVRHESMPGLVSRADIVVDQIRSGSYGVAAAEGLAAGRLIVGNVSRATRAEMPEEPPIVDAPPDNFRDVMEDILGNRERYAGQAALGPAFARRWHSGQASAEALSQFVRRGA